MASRVGTSLSLSLATYSAMVVADWNACVCANNALAFAPSSLIVPSLSSKVFSDALMFLRIRDFCDASISKDTAEEAMRAKQPMASRVGTSLSLSLATYSAMVVADWNACVCANLKDAFAPSLVNASSWSKVLSAFLIFLRMRDFSALSFDDDDEEEEEEEGA
eukprot:CAMPEP_0119205566 /NCGR_PEP_ID=MMETSP1316-20130426/39950_1 /TAXON_ID=41880 /ORGANISM="Pycnococcus provasolii, Strain RCC2336" /LENGTH=162 /DNA_ID=CAMNT_0007201955 /DNA_START=521 /DNA_END=1009 /DNA_ORIENTATION=-